MSSSFKEKYRKYYNSPIFLILLISVFSSCSDWNSYDLPGQEIENEQQLLINVVDVNENSITGYTLDIEGPVSHHQSGVTKSTFALDNLQDGTYKITVKKEGYLDAETDITVDLPGKDVTSHYDEVSLVLQQRADTQVIDYREGGIIRTAPSVENEIFGEPITLSFSPYALPSSLADETGHVQISANRIIPTDIDETYEGTVQSYIIFDNGIGELNESVSIEIPMQIASEYAGELTYTLQPGNIPLEIVESSVSGSNEMQNKGSRGRQMRAKAPGLQNYAVVANLQVRQSVSWTDFKVVEQGGCEEDVTVSYTLESGDAKTLAQQHSNLASKLSGQTYTLDKTFKGVPFKKVTIEVRNKIREFTVRELPSKTEIEHSEVQEKPIQFRTILKDCHNSGGS
ncbi:carboxypeptidase regulatory-like domain-containing protein [Rhodohalobacter sp. SW132]|uniref:carboxypeptidase-like regulatory domain-containing protein n=1 Tax=Rhodohalobacter sp. SW132 TaxID=2293433 RepID=UPI000E220F3A|nr:carboxypeptidase-like regulatory domain-containing protein [Rhodohalobacter sp. SW132]REL33815.1 carboxypeptidase regulatory-like domain-containing protein [Rhodohalobacter sp. SW132]